MTPAECAAQQRIEQLEQEVAYWREIALGETEDERTAILLKQGFRPQTARIALALYRRACRSVRSSALSLAIPCKDGRERDDDNASVKIYIMHLRRQLGSPDTVETIFGMGYRLTAKGHATLRRMLGETAALRPVLVSA